jgi:competence protein ComEC
MLAGLAAFDAQRGMLFCWVPVCLGIGIGLYFALPVEPPVPGLLALAGVALALGLLLRRRLLAWPPLPGLLLVAAGLLMAAGRAHWVAAPVLEFRYYGPVSGRVLVVDRSASDAVRLTLDRVVLEDVPPGRTPGRVRLSLHGQQGWVEPLPGMRVMTTGHLSPPAGPVEPGGFDFQRRAWFDGLGAVGYTRTPLLAEARAPPGPGRASLARLRLHLAQAIRAALPGERGAFAAAIMTGDRSAMGRETLEALRAANLAHLLAISGLHMGLLTGFVFMAVRLGLALVPGWALRHPIKAWAAAAALAAGAVYLALSGGNVATQRAFIMVSVMLLAVMMGRRALTLRAVALAAVIVLLLAPESLTEPGFQMSFAATTALVAVFRLLRDIAMAASLPRWAQPLLAMVVSSAVAGVATAPIAAAHFNIVSHFGLLANLLSVPLMGVYVMPMAVLTALLSLFGLGGLGLAAMAPAIGWILGVAHHVSGLEGAVGRVVAPPGAVLPLVALGALVVILWRGRGRWAGLAPLCAAAALWAGAERPPLLVSETGGLMGLMTAQGRALSKPRGDGFAAASWLENDGDGALQAAAAARAGFEEADMLIRLQLGPHRLAHLRGKSGPGRVPEACATADLVVLVGRREGAGQPPCRVLDIRDLRRTGALAIYPGDGGLRVVGARQAAGRRLWSGSD